jgi:hypothetical protein
MNELGRLSEAARNSLAIELAQDMRQRIAKRDKDRSPEAE